MTEDVKKGVFFRLNEDLWKEFTLKCFKNNESKQEVLTEFIEIYVKEKIEGKISQIN